MSKRPGVDWEVVPSSQWAESLDSFNATSSTPVDPSAGETSGYWEEVIPDSCPTAEYGLFAHHEPPETKRQRRDSISAPDALPDFIPPAQPITRKFRVTKSFGSGDHGGGEKKGLSSEASAWDTSAPPSIGVPSLTWSSGPAIQLDPTLNFGNLELKTPVSRPPPATHSSLPYDYFQNLPERIFDPRSHEQGENFLPNQRADSFQGHFLGVPSPEVLPPTPQEEDTYIIGTSDEEDLAKLIDSISAKPMQIPPSSVIRSMDSGSSREVFDPNLPGSPPEKAQNNTTSENVQVKEEDLLDSDVEWDEIIELLPSRPHDPSLSVSPQETTPRPLPKPQEVKPLQLTPQHKPFPRPPFPTPIRDKSPIAGLSRSSILRTCFRIGQLLNETKKCFDAKQDAIFELYARVNYSSREKNARVQHFQFMDLFTEHPPIPSGTLNGWKTGSLIDEQSQLFLGSGGGRDAKMCRCICKPVREKKRDLGWSFSVLSIREADWEEIEAMKRMMCGA
ncbi:hypothetical protein B0T16DRAFT_357193 [Cercophora newfieldiana]|uniref:Uncharacterized protein n=1 Tax=Cercophora newfieldiana TaxID=92897 RepID=A0AA40CJQ2_9PEZI|nr:hypothetical protein B0T16DRAFT_357193 [Cercophora newfieldiana]